MEWILSAVVQHLPLLCMVGTDHILIKHAPPILLITIIYGSALYRSIPSVVPIRCWLMVGSLSLIPRDGYLISRACRTHRTKFSLQVIEPRNLRKRVRSDKNTPQRPNRRPFLLLRNTLGTTSVRPRPGHDRCQN